jgi:hypothetical protein
MYVYFFAGPWYTLFSRGETGAGSIVAGYNPPRSISDWGWPTFTDSTQRFGADGIDAALYSGSKSYFFKGPYYIRVTRTEPTGFGTQDFDHPHPISEWNFCDGFGADGIDAALWSGPVTYFFKGDEYIRVTRGEDDFGNGCDPGYPKTIAGGWGWPAPFSNLVKAALPSGLVDYFFSGNDYIRVSRGIELAGSINAGYPNDNAHGVWGFPSGFATNGPDAALYSGGALEPEPSGGLTSDVNYWLGDNGNDLTGVSVTINIDNDLISTQDGFGFQLNAMSQAIPNVLSAIIQQLIIYSPRNTNELVGRIFMYSSNGGPDPAPFQISFDEQVSIATLPAVNTIKAGSSVRLDVLNDASTGKVTGCKFTYTTPNGASVSQTLNIADGTIEQTGQKATLAYMQPIDAITMDIVADYTPNGGPTGAATLSSGEGTISYSANQGLTAYTSTPPYSNVWSITSETANTVYAALPGGRPIDVSQLWGMTPPVPVDLSGLEKMRRDVYENRTVFSHSIPPPLPI